MTKRQVITAIIKDKRGYVLSVGQNSSNITTATVYDKRYFYGYRVRIALRRCQDDVESSCISCPIVTIDLRTR